MIFVCSDWHFHHNKEFLYAPRGFGSPEEMNQEIIRRHNDIVGSNDEVYFLGDGFLSCTAEEGCACINKLNGKIHWIIGNHCTDNKLAAIQANCPNVIDIAFGARLRYQKVGFYLSHCPTLCGDSVWNIHGHTHSKDKFELEQYQCYNAALDAHDCYPVCIDQIIEDIKTKRSEQYGQT